MICPRSRFGEVGLRITCFFINVAIFIGPHYRSWASPIEISTSIPENVTEKTESFVTQSVIKDVTTEGPKNFTDILESNSTLSSEKNNSTSMNYVIEYKPQVFDSPEDIKTQQEWGGNCTLANWDNCKVLASWFGKYEDPKDGEIKEYLIDCKEEPVVCLKNSWTVTRCNLLCMSRCNREIQYKYDKYVSHDGECQAHSHG